MTTKTWACWALAAVLLGSAGLVRADDPEPGEGDAATSEKSATRMKVFQLAHRDPQEIRALLGMVPAPEKSGPVVDGLRIAADSRTKTLFVRGLEADIQCVEQIVKAVDVPADKLTKGAVQGLYLLPVRHADPEEVVAVLQQLGIDARTQRLDRATLLVFLDKDESVKEAEQVVDILDADLTEPEAAQASVEE